MLQLIACFLLCLFKAAKMNCIYSLEKATRKRLDYAIGAFIFQVRCRLRAPCERVSAGARILVTPYGDPSLTGTKFRFSRSTETMYAPAPRCGGSGRR